MGKTPVIKHDFSTSKDPKVLLNPTQHSSQNIAWQLHRLDLEGPWGLSFIRNLQSFKIEDHWFADLADIHDDLYNAITSMDKKEFPSVDHFLNKLSLESNGNLTAEHQRIILRGLVENIFWQEIFPKLSHFENSTWHSIDREGFGSRGKTKHHAVKVEKIAPEAQKRLTDLKLDDIEELYSMRLTGKIRIWGIRRFNIFQVLWFDLNHEVCPSNPN